MAQSFAIEGVGEVLLPRLQYRGISKDFLLESDDGSLGFKVNYGFADYSIPLDSVMVVVCFAPHQAENDIKIVRDFLGAKSVGWLCTVGALISKEHEYVDNEHFRRGSAMAVRYLLERERPHFDLMVGNDETIDIFRLYDQDASVLIVNLSLLPQGAIREGSLLPLLFQNGFVVYSSSSKERWDPGDVVRDRFKKCGRNLNLRVPVDLGEVRFAQELFESVIPLADGPVFKFYYYYQIIEAFLNKVFELRQGTTIDLMQRIKHDPIRLHDAIEDLLDDSKAKTKINCLFNDYSGVSSKILDLFSACEDFILTLRGEVKKKRAESLYEVRNVVFHAYHMIGGPAFEKIDKVVGELEWAIPELILSFRIGANDPEYFI